VLFQALSLVKARFEAGERDANALRTAMREVIATEPGVEIDYVSLADVDTLQELERIETGALVSLAARLGKTRLIDNLLLG
jgi:pantoate--beta-alanine ligase